MASQPAIIQDEETLPEGWVAYNSTVPRKYYYNEKTRISQWEKPTKRKHKTIGSYDANVAVRKYNKILEIFEKTLCGFYPSTTPEYDHIINRMKLEVEENCTELHNKRSNERKVTNNLLSNEAWLMLFVEKLLKVMQVKQSIINDEEAKQNLKNEYLDKLNRAKKNSDIQEELGICIFVDKLLMLLEPRNEEVENVSESIQETLGSWESVEQYEDPVLNAEMVEAILGDHVPEEETFVMQQQCMVFDANDIHNNGDPEVRTQLRSDSSKRPAELIESEPVNHTPKVRVIPSDEVNLNDNSFYLYVANRFHPCFLPTTVKERFISILFNEENSNNVSDEQLLRKLKEEEDADVKDLWEKVGISFVQISAEGEGITQALLKKVRNNGSLALAIFQNSVKSTEYNKVQFAKYNNITRKISDSKEDDRMWDTTVPGTVVAVPWLRPFLRHYFDVSRKVVTIMRGKNLDKDLTITVHGEEIPIIIKHTESQCVPVRRDIGQKYETIVIQTNHCLVFCAEKYIHREDVEVSSFDSESRHELFGNSKQNVFIINPKERNGLLLGYHLHLSAVLNVNGIPIEDRATFKTFLWTPHIALLNGVNVQEIESLSIRGKFDEDEIRDDRLLWPMPNNMIRTL